MATPFDRLMTTIRPHLPGAIDEAVRQELYMACMDFLKWSTAWREDIEFTLDTGDMEGEIVPFAGRVDRLINVAKDGLPVRGVFMPSPGVVRFRSAPNAPEVYVATVSLMVTDPMTRDAYPIIPYELVTKYTEELMHGTLAKMMAQPLKPYTNMVMAQFYLNKFRGGASRARNDINTGYTTGSQKWTFPQTFSNR